MRSGNRVTAILFALALIAGAAPEVGAQSVLSSRGLGFPIQPLDARARGLGGAALGLPEPSIDWSNPAAAVGLPAPAISFAHEFTSYSAEFPGGSINGKTVRFPLVLAAIPAGERVAFQIGFGSYLDQNWRIIEPDTLILSPDTVPVRDWWDSDGGVSRLRFGVGADVGRNVSLGVGVNVYTGAVERLVGRAFPSEPRPACCLATWNFSGLGLTAGAHWSPTSDSGVAASVTVGGSLTAEPQDSIGARSEYDLPLVVQVGASGRVGTNLLVVVGADWTGWSSVDGGLADDAGAADSWSANLGLEWDAMRLRDLPFPVRLGARTAKLPFRWNDDSEGSLTERAISLGAGLDLGGGGVQPNMFVEFGNRGGADGLDESFWRMGLSVRVLGR
jgi:hypothetical protein